MRLFNTATVNFTCFTLPLKGFLLVHLKHESGVVFTAGLCVHIQLIHSVCVCLCTWHKVLSAANASLRAYVRACDHVCTCTPVCLAWRVEHCKPISPKQDLYKTPSKHFLEAIQWNGRGRCLSLAVKQEELVSSGEIDSWQLYCLEASLHGWIIACRRGETEREREGENKKRWTESPKSQNKSWFSWSSESRLFKLSKLL